MKKIHPTDRERIDAIERADGFIVTTFLGHGRYERAEVKTLIEAQALARDRCDTTMIYAKVGTRSIHVENVDA